MTVRKFPYVSCVIPAHNGAEFLPEAIESALNQNFPKSEREIIVVDDGSTDRTAEVLKRYKGEIRSLRQANKGQGEALRMAIRASCGEIIAELDQDDIWRPQKLARIARAFDASKDITVVSHTVEDVDNLLRPISLPESAPNVPADLLIDLQSESVLLYSERKEWVGTIVCAGGSSWSVRKEALLQKLDRAKPPRIWADLFYVFMAAASGGKAMRLREPLSLWRWHEKSASFCEPANFQKRIDLLKQFDAAVVRTQGVIDASRCPLLAEDLMACLRWSAARSVLLESRISRKSRPAA